MLTRQQTTEAWPADGEYPEGWSPPERAIVDKADGALADGLDLLRWWKQIDAANGYSNRFNLIRQFNWSDRSFGFFDNAPISDGMLPVMGVVEELTFDQPRSQAPEWVRDQLREFVLHYFMRVSAFEEPEAFADPGRVSPRDFEPGISWCPAKQSLRAGFGYSQHFYKLAESGALGRFPPHERYTCVDLREIGARYAWTICKVQVFDFNLTLQPSGPDAAAVIVPLKEENYLLLSRDFITNREKPAPGILAEYGLGYALIRASDSPSIFAYGPGQFRAGFQLINFQVLDSGEVRASLVFVANRPDRVLDITLDPIDWSLQAANLFSLGLASRVIGQARQILNRLPLRVGGFDPVSTYITVVNSLMGEVATADLCISREQLERVFLVQHFKQHYRMMVGSLLTWRHTPDWLDSRAIPESIVTGWFRES
jgi:hypothetical protein